MTVSWLGWWIIHCTEHEEILIIIPVLFLPSKVAWGKLFHLREFQFLLYFEVNITCFAHLTEKVRWKNECKIVLKWWCYSKGNTVVCPQGMFLDSGLLESLWCCTPDTPRRPHPSSEMLKVLDLLPEAQRPEVGVGSSALVNCSGLNSVAPKFMSTSNLRNVTSLGYGVFGDWILNQDVILE